jgi:hypothetical protein
VSSGLDFEDEGIKIQVLIPEKLQFRKTLTGYKAACPQCGTAEIELGKKYLQETNPSEAKLPALELLKNAKTSNEIVAKAPIDNLLKWLRDYGRYRKIREKGASDDEVFDFELECPICRSVFNLTTHMTNPVQIEEITLRDALKTIPIKRDPFTLKAVARVAVVQKFPNPEAYLDDIEKRIAEFGKIDHYVQKIKDLITEGRRTFASGGCMSEFVDLLDGDLATVPEAVKATAQRELDDKIKELTDSAFQQFPDEQTLPKIIQKVANAVKGETPVLLIGSEQK